LSLLPFIGNLIVFVMAVKYAPYSPKRTLKHRVYRWIKRRLK
jgi:hypothetical protein